MKMRKYLPYLIGVSILAVILAVYFSKSRPITQRPPVVTSPAEKSTSISKEKIAPDFSLKTLKGNTINLSDFNGKVIIIDFWATSCPPCRAEIPHFIILYEKYRDEGFQMLGVVLDEDKASVEDFAKEYNINYPLLIPDKKVLKDYGPIIYIPTTFVISSDGYIYKKYVGYQPESVFEEDLKTLLARERR